MKKFFKITAAVILLLLIFCFGILKYRQYQADDILIPKATNTLIKVDVDGLMKQLATNALLNWPYYFKNEDRVGAKKEKKPAIEMGLSIPAHLYFYSLKNWPNTYFVRLKINDYTAFENYMKQKLKASPSPLGTSIKTVNLKSIKTVFYYNHKNLVLAVNNTINQKEINRLLDEVLAQKSFISLKSSGFVEKLKHKSDIVAIKKNCFTSIDFNNGEIEFTHTLQSPEKLSITQREAPLLTKQAVTAQLWLNFKFQKNVYSKYKILNTNLAVDSLLKYYNGALYLAWADSFKQTDTVVTYEYDDNFNKTSIKKEVKKTVPKAFAKIKADGFGLLQYLRKQNIVQPESSIISEKIFPLFKIGISAEKNELSFYTKQAATKPLANTKTEDYLSIFVDFKKVQQQLKIPLLNEFLQPLNRLEVKGKLENEHRLKVSGHLSLINKDINACYQLIKLF